MPKISVIMPVFNVEKYIGESVTSVCAQSFRDFEVIIVDDGSLDNSINIAENLLRKANVKYKILRQENKGLSSARNAGINSSDGEWIICVDPDDRIHKQTLQTIYNSAKDSGCDAVAFGFRRTVKQTDDYEMPDSEAEFTVFNQSEAAQAFLLRKPQLIAPAMLIRKSLLTQRNICYDESCFFSEDQLFIWTLIMNTSRLCFVDIPLYYYLSRKDSITNCAVSSEILTGLSSFERLENKLAGNCDPDIDIKCILPRWIIGALHSSAKHMNYMKFKKLAADMKYEGRIRILVGFADKKVRLSARILLLSLRMFYLISRAV